MTGFNWSRIPVILVEMGFLSNKEEDKLLSSQEYQDKIANALAEGIFAAVK
jgi:N-acetylmuramoyl-L-alanine amidase